MHISRSRGILYEYSRRTISTALYSQAVPTDWLTDFSLFLFIYHDNTHPTDCIDISFLSLFFFLNPNNHNHKDYHCRQSQPGRVRCLPFLSIMLEAIPSIMARMSIQGHTNCKYCCDYGSYWFITSYYVLSKVGSQGWKWSREWGFDCRYRGCELYASSKVMLCHSIRQTDRQKDRQIDYWILQSERNKKRWNSNGMVTLVCSSVL